MWFSLASISKTINRLVLESELKRAKIKINMITSKSWTRLIIESVKDHYYLNMIKLTIK